MEKIRSNTDTMKKSTVININELELISVSVGPNYVVGKFFFFSINSFFYNFNLFSKLVTNKEEMFIWGCISPKSNSQVPVQIEKMRRKKLFSVCCGRNSIMAAVKNGEGEQLDFSMYNPNEIIGGTLEGLVRYLVKERDQSFSFTFWSTYFTFCSGTAFFKILKKM